MLTEDANIFPNSLRRDTRGVLYESVEGYKWKKVPSFLDSEKKTVLSSLDEEIILRIVARNYAKYYSILNTMAMSPLDMTKSFFWTQLIGR